MPSSFNLYRQLLLLLSALSTSLCAPLNVSTSGLITSTADCYDYEIPITTQTEALVYAFPEFSDNYDVAGVIGAFARRDAATTFLPFNGTKNATGDYTISAIFCSPKSPSDHEKTVLLTTHGLAFDRRYVFMSSSTRYNINDALATGPLVYSQQIIASLIIASQEDTLYSFMTDLELVNLQSLLTQTLKTSLFNINSYIRVSGYTESQFSTQLAILESLTNSIRQGSYTGNIGKPLKVVHVGHSYGAILSQALVTAKPTISDGIVLQGIGFNASTSNFAVFFESARLNIANTVSPGKYAALDNEVLWYTQDVGQPAAIAEFLTGSIGSTPAAFTGPVSILSIL
jgi:hypothetical protein